MRLFFFLTSALFIVNFSAQSKTVFESKSFESDTIFIPKNYTSGWVLDSKGKKELMDLKFQVNEQRIIFVKNGRMLTFSIGIEKFGFTNEKNEEIVFERIINKTLNQFSGFFFQDLAESQIYKLVAFHKVVETEDAPFIDVKTKVQKLEQVYFLSENGIFKTVKLNKKSFIDYFEKYEVELKDYLKKTKVDFNNSKDLNALLVFIESLKK